MSSNLRISWIFFGCFVGGGSLQAGYPLVQSHCQSLECLSVGEEFSNWFDGIQHRLSGLRNRDRMQLRLRELSAGQNEKDFLQHPSSYFVKVQVTRIGNKHWFSLDWKVLLKKEFAKISPLQKQSLNEIFEISGEQINRALAEVPAPLMRADHNEFEISLLWIGFGRWDDSRETVLRAKTFVLPTAEALQKKHDGRLNSIYGNDLLQSHEGIKLDESQNGSWAYSKAVPSTLLLDIAVQ